MSQDIDQTPDSPSNNSEENVAPNPMAAALIARLQASVSASNNAVGAGVASVNPQQIQSPAAQQPIEWRERLQQKFDEQKEREEAAATASTPLDSTTETIVETTKPGVVSVVSRKESWIDKLPPITGDQFVLEAEWDGAYVIFCMQELFWREAVDIEAASFRKGERDNVFFSGEYDKRETLRRAIIWVAEPSSQTVRMNHNGDILRHLHHSIVEALWIKYMPFTELDAQEANALYVSARNYFAGKSQAGHPTPSIILCVDMLCKPISTMTFAEWQKIKITDYHRIKTVMMAREEALGYVSDAQQQSKIIARLGKQEKTKQEVLAEMPDYMFPDNMGNVIKNMNAPHSKPGG